MKFEIKDPGSAITHFIGMLMAAFAATPLLIRAASNPDKIHLISLSIFIISMILLYAASTTYHTLNLSERTNRILRKIDHCMIFMLIAGSYAGVPDCAGRQGRVYPLRHRLGHRHRRHYPEAVLDHLPQMVFLCAVYRHGLGVRAGFHADSERPVIGGLRLAAGGRHHLHGGRYYLRAEAAAV